MSRYRAIPRTAAPCSGHIFRIGRGTTLQSGLSIAYATLDHIYRNIRCRTLFATHIHELADKVCQPDTKEPLPGIQFWCTDLEEMVSDQLIERD